MNNDTTRPRAWTGRGQASGRRLPFGPLEPLAGETMVDVAGRAGVHRRTLYRLRAEGLDPWEADHFAVVLGRHPLAVWGEAWELSIDRDVATYVKAIDRYRRRPPTDIQWLTLSDRFRRALLAEGIE